MPVTIAHLGGAARGITEVGEQHRGKNPIVGDTGLFAGDELGDLLELLPPRLDEVVHVAPWQLNVLRARNVVCDWLAMRGQDDRGVSELEDKCWRADGRHDSG